MMRPDIIIFSVTTTQGTVERCKFKRTKNWSVTKSKHSYQSLLEFSELNKRENTYWDIWQPAYMTRLEMDVHNLHLWRVIDRFARLILDEGAKLTMVGKNHIHFQNWHLMSIASSANKYKVTPEEELLLRWRILASSWYTSGLSKDMYEVTGYEMWYGPIALYE